MLEMFETAQARLLSSIVSEIMNSTVDSVDLSICSVLSSLIIVICRAGARGSHQTLFAALGETMHCCNLGHPDHCPVVGPL